MRPTLFLAVVVVAAPASAQTAPPLNLRAALEDYLQSTNSSSVELASLGTPVKAATCRIFDRGKGIWVSFVETGTAIHVRYRTRDRFGATVMQSKIAFVDDKGKVVDAFDTSSVKSTDRKLIK